MFVYFKKINGHYVCPFCANNFFLMKKSLQSHFLEFHNIKKKFWQRRRMPNSLTMMLLKKKMNRLTGENIEMEEKIRHLERKNNDLKKRIRPIIQIENQLNKIEKEIKEKEKEKEKERQVEKARQVEKERQMEKESKKKEINLGKAGNEKKVARVKPIIIGDEIPDFESESESE